MVRNDLTGRACGMPWEPALLVGRWLMRMPTGEWPPDPVRLGPFVIRKEEDAIILAELSGKLFMELPLTAAREAGRIIITKAHEIEQEEKAERVIEDHALLARRGVRIGLAIGEMAKEAAREAAWNSKLRRHIPSSGKLLQEVMYPPRLIGGTEK